MDPENSFRQGVYRFVENKWFQNIILLLIIVSTVTLALESPLDDPEGDKISTVSVIDLFMTIVFTIEVIVKVIAYGFIFAGKSSYLRESWNILDFTIVTAALIDVIAGDKVDVGFLKAMRILKILRPLRLISR